MMRCYMWVFPELRRFASVRESKIALHKAAGRVYLAGYFIGCSLLAVLAGGWRVIQSHTGLPELVLMGLGVAVAGVGGCFGVWLGRKRICLLLRNQLNDQGIPVCTRCGYDLRCLRDNRCPECGDIFEPLA